MIRGKKSLLILIIFTRTLYVRVTLIYFPQTIREEPNLFCFAL